MKKKLFIGIALAGLVLAIGCGTGCGTPKMAPGGAYAGGTNAAGMVTAADPTFYQVDALFFAAWTSANTVFTAEYNNRALFKTISPSIKTGLDAIRPGAVTAWKDYATARKAYVANPTPAGLTTLQTILAKIQALAAAATAVIGTTVVPTTTTP